MESPKLDSRLPSFASQVRGRDARRIDVILGHLAHDVYENESSELVDGWRPLSAQELEEAGLSSEDLVNTKSGFAARIYTDESGHYVLAFRGTNEGKDWPHNLKQGLGLLDVQYEQADRLASKAAREFGQENLVITGHSLGGGLATAASLRTKCPAVTFNASGLHDNTIERLELDPAYAREATESGLVRRYAVDRELLTGLQEKHLLTRLLLPDALGHKIELPDPHPVGGWKQLIPGSSLRHAIDNHGMDAVIEAQDLSARGSMDTPAHPANGMFNDALGGLKGITSETLGFHSDSEYRNAAGALVAKAHQAGMQRIDHVVIGANGALFAVEGPLDDASHRIASVDKAQAAALPIEASSEQVRQLQSEAPDSQAQRLEIQRRTALNP
jgi:hypothetical protein